ncbi:amidohydrolase family protein [Haladaptatus sp. AB643]|uniref:amidohydrolase family protein n=1 Tax=Haladaptatus sp. AB643 TaxID=2934174 RepID=UPI00209BF4E1|nr:amidohydrolase family protein [Haladaptatus sp. AB643]MCO8243796.1 amidohydrolase [Haladaptatus sp. AB643]
MRLIDTHVHAWGADSEQRPWYESVLPPGWSGEYTHEDLIVDMNRVGIDESVIVTTPLYGRERGANDYTLECIAAHPDRLHGVGLVDFFADDVRDRLRAVLDHDGMLGVRMHAALEYDDAPTELDRTGDWILDDALAPVWEEMATLDGCVFVFPKAQQLGLVGRLAAAHPDVTFVVDHMAWPDGTTTTDSEPWSDFRDLAAFDNVYVKVSSLPRSSIEGWPYRDLWGYVRNLVEWFGADRLMLGSDYPWMDDWATYDQCLDWVTEARFLSPRDQRYLRARTFTELFDA